MERKPAIVRVNAGFVHRHPATFWSKLRGYGRKRHARPDRSGERARHRVAVHLFKQRILELTRPKRGRLAGASPEQTAERRSRVGGLLRVGVSFEAVRPARSVGTASHSDVLLETVGSAKTPTCHARSVRRLEATSDPPHSSSQKLQTHGQDHSQQSRTGPWWDRPTRGLQVKDC